MGTDGGCRFGRNVKWKEMEAGARAVVVKIEMVAIPASELPGERAAHLAFPLSVSYLIKLPTLVDQVVDYLTK